MLNNTYVRPRWENVPWDDRPRDRVLVWVGKPEGWGHHVYLDPVTHTVYAQHGIHWYRMNGTEGDDV